MSKNLTLLASLTIAATLTLAGCGGGGTAPTPPNPPPPGNDNVTVSVQRALPNLSFLQPLALIRHDDRWYVAERGGRIHTFTDNAATSDVVLDISARVNSGANEAGLLGFAFHPEVAANGAIYLSYTGGAALESRLSYFAFDAGTASIDPGSEQILATVPQPAGNHNGGHVLFEPGTFNLYWGLGDGGGAGDPANNAQRPHNWLGTIVRVDLSTPNVIAIPNDNPFIAGIDGAPEVYMYGLRNPWRFDQDPVTADMYIGDVGQATVEEINLGVAGGNYGWRCFEGFGVFDSSAGCPDRSDTITPIAEINRNEGQSVTGGRVYRGSAIPGLVGRFVFGDFVTGSLFSIERTNTGFARQLIGTSSLNIASFGADDDGELYVLSYSDGTIHKIVP